VGSVTIGRTHLEAVLSAWVYGIAKAGSILGNAALFFRLAMSEAFVQFRRDMGIELASRGTPKEACEAYLDELRRIDFLDPVHIRIEAEGEELHVHVGDGCPYRAACYRVKDAGIPIQCVRALTFTHVIEACCAEEYDYELKTFGEECDLRLAPRFHLQMKEG
jgi:hypothetical protein